MMRFSKKSSAIVVGVSTLALVGGPSLAMAASDGKIGSWKIRDGAVHSKDIRDKTIRNKDIRFNAANKPWVARQIESIPAGEKGDEGPQGKPGADGAPGKDGVSMAETHKPTAGIVTVEPGTVETATAVCGPDTFALGGGYEVEGNRTEGVEVLRNQPTGDYAQGMFNQWSVEVRNNSARAFTVQPAVVCADVTTSQPGSVR